MSEDEATFLDLLLEFLIGVDRDGVALAIVERLLVDVLLDLVEELSDVIGDAVEGAGLLGERVTASNFYRAVLEVTTTEGQAYGYALELVFGEFPPGLLVVCVVVAHADAALLQLGDEGLDVAADLVTLLECLVDGDDDDLMRGERWGRTRPLSSEWLMMSAPIRRVDTPHEVAHTSSCWPSLLVKVTSKALAKFCPRKCDVPLCSALPSCIRASMV